MSSAARMMGRTGRAREYLLPFSLNMRMWKSTRMSCRNMPGAVMTCARSAAPSGESFFAART
jgi:hypothetical protein